MSRCVQRRVVERHLNAVWAIASSRYVGQFVIGYTSQGGRNRSKAYRYNCYDHLIVLEDRLTKRQALDLEERLQAACKFGRARGEPYRRKHHPDHRALGYRRSAGQGSPNPDAPIHSVYMAWIEP